MNIITTQPISTDFYHKYSTFIDQFGPRPSGSPILERAIDHMINLTLDSGINDIRTESVTVPYWKRGDESLTMILPVTKNIAILGLGPSVPTPLNGITAEVIIVKCFPELDESVQGKIVLFNVPFTTYEETVNYRIHGATAAAKWGAVAVLVRSITPFSLYTPHTGSLYYENSTKKIPAAAITLEDADYFERIYNRGERILVNLKMFSEFSLKESRNVIIDLKGQKNPEKIIVVSGHIDSWDVGRGAIDDGGGMMISWFVPVILNYLSIWPRRTIRCILWTSEEPGYIGAAAYLKQHSSDIHNIDFIMESDAGTFEPLGLEVAGSENVKCLMENLLRLFTPIDELKYANTVGSDIALFVKLGIPGASLLNKNDRYFWFHHTQADTLTAQNDTNVIKCAAFWAAVTYVIADLPFEIPL
ncbi:carboxypeptidase Q-like [Maniola hyperantus]|uniref:carboxypeptidase Q-like n=1 Tax=Aphantopus hyperantus TaxID=2795564 RepID=UPI0015692512|nr:carboxypeptidase Q-like [Maniola hyperantus]